MIILIEGENDYLAKRAINQIKAKYLSKNTDTELLEIDPDSSVTNWADLQAVPLFATSRLVVITAVGNFTADLQEGLARTLDKKPDTTVVVLWDKKKLHSSLQGISTKAAKKIPALQPTEREIITILKARTKELGSDPLETSWYSQLIAEHGSDLWTLETALFAYISGEIALESTHKKTIDDQFGLFRLVDQGKWPAVATRVVEEYQAGKPIEVIIGGIASALRRSKASKVEVLDRVSLLSDIDLGLKTGLIEEEDAVALLFSYLPSPRTNRLQWEKVWEEIHT